MAQPAVALTNKELFWLTKTLAVVPAAMVYRVGAPHGFESPLAFDDTSMLGVKFKEGFWFPILGSGITYAGANKFLNWVFGRFTPRERYEWAQKRLHELEADYLFNEEIRGDSIAQVLQDSGCEASELPLVAAFLKLQNFDKQLNFMIHELARALEDDESAELNNRIETLKKSIAIYLKKVRSNEAAIKQQPQWLEQWKIYEQRVIEREKMVHPHVHTHLVVNRV